MPCSGTSSCHTSARGMSIAPRATQRSNSPAQVNASIIAKRGESLDDLRAERQPDFFVEQQEALATRLVSCFAAVTTYSGGATSWAWAQATFCWLVKQQHPRQHCSALRQPQWRCMQGNGCDRSLPPAPDHTGCPTLATKNATKAMPAQGRIKREAAMARRGRMAQFIGGIHRF